VPWTPAWVDPSRSWQAQRPTLPRPVLAGVIFLTGCVLAAGLVYLWWSETPAQRLQTSADDLIMAAQLTGLLSAYLLLVEVTLTARIRWLERRLGSWLAQAHRYIGSYLIALICVHVICVIAGYCLSLNATPWAVITVLMSNYPYVLAATVGFALLLVVAVSSARSIRRRLGYDRWHTLHLITYPAAAAAFFHQITLGAQFTRSAWAAGGWIAVHVAVGATVLVNRIALPIRNHRRHQLRILRVERANSNTITIYVSGKRIDELGAQAGQYFRWRFLTRGLWYQAHPFSLSAAPQGNTLRLTVRGVGGYTRRLKRRLRPGVRVLAEGPYGAFTSVLRRRPKVLLIGGGVGVTPLRAIAETLHGKPGDVLFIQRVSQLADLLLTAELEALHAAGRLTYLTVVGERGRDRQKDPLSGHRLRTLIPDIGEREVFICGSAGLTASVVRSLRRAGLPRGRIHLELFDF
jgi:predicted ferric reductase